MNLKKILIIAGTILAGHSSLEGQKIDSLRWVRGLPFRIHSFFMNSAEETVIEKSLPLFTFKINDRWINPSAGSEIPVKGGTGMKTDQGLEIICENDSGFVSSFVLKLVFSNKGQDTLHLSNILPFGKSQDRVYITAEGPAALARAKLFIPGNGPIDVTLPDNAWDLGYSSLSL